MLLPLLGTSPVPFFPLGWPAQRAPCTYISVGCVCFRADLGRLQLCSLQQGGTDGARHRQQKTVFKAPPTRDNTRARQGSMCQTLYHVVVAID
jgi:hypothetical protein